MNPLTSAYRYALPEMSWNVIAGTPNGRAHLRFKGCVGAVCGRPDPFTGWLPAKKETPRCKLCMRRQARMDGDPCAR